MIRIEMKREYWQALAGALESLPYRDGCRLAHVYKTIDNALGKADLEDIMADFAAPIKEG